MDKLFIRKDVYEELLEKGFGKKDYSKLTKKVITDKNGHKRTVFVKNDVEQTEQKQPKAQEGLTPEKKARYEEMLEKVKTGSDENALFVRGKGMLNKKDAIAHLSEKLGMKVSNQSAEDFLHGSEPTPGKIMRNQQQQIMDANDNKVVIKRKYGMISLYGAKTGDHIADFQTEKARLDFMKENNLSKPDANTPSPDIKGGEKTIDRYKELYEGKKKTTSSAAQGHLEADEPLNTDITAEDEKRFGKQALSGLSGKRTSSEEYKENYLDAKNEGGKDIADENRVDNHSKNAINLSDSEVKKMQKLFDYIPENAKGNQIMNTIYDEDKNLYKKLSEMDIEYKKLHPEAEGKTFGFDLATKYLEDSFNEYKKDHEVGKDKFAEMSVEDIRKEQQNLLDDYNQYYNAYKNGKNDGSKLREYFKKFDVYKTALDKKSKK